MKRFDRLDSTIAAIATIKVLIGLLGAIYRIAGYTDHISPSRLIVHTALVLSFGTLGALAFFTAREHRARMFGLVLLLIANAYALPLIVAFSPRGVPWRDFNVLFLNFRVELLVVWYLWRFIGEFPETPVPFAWQRIFGHLQMIAGASGGLLVLAIGPLRLFKYFNKILVLPPLLEMISLQAYTQWNIVIPQVLGVLLALVLKWLRATGPEKRRAQLLLFALLVCFGVPSVSITLDTVVPAYSDFFDRNGHLMFYNVLFGNLVLLALPFVASYAVIAQKVLDVQLIARSAVQHLLARYSATVLGLAPFFFLVLFLFQNRHLTLEQLFTGNQAIVLAATTAVGLVFLRFRQPILDAIDRRFFRDRYNAKRVLTQLADQVRGTRNVRELSNMVVQGVDLALHLERVALLAQDQQLGRFVDPQDNLRPLDPGSRLATLIQGQREPLEVDLDSPSSPLQGLDEQEKHWLVDGKIEMIAPTYALDGGMIGLLALGGKKSELPFLKEDRDLLQSVCSATGLVLELMTLKEKTVPPRQPTPIPPSPSGAFPAHAIADPEDVARECAVCQRLYPPTEARCPNDDFELEPTVVPFVLRGQYRFEKRLGAGGMAVVYLATDLRLGRVVAIKTLPRVSPEAAMRLHREARTAATVNHPGLAGIYGIETWQGTPMLVLEYLPGGTLADQLTQGEPLDPLLAVDMGKTVALALQKIHGAGILHRDIKPSNIGYDEEGLAKLLDFGVARIQHDLRQEAETGPADEPLDSRSRVANTADWVIGRTATGQLVGTISYLSPEAVRGARPEPSFDLWALNVVLWESLTGKNLFGGRVFRKVLDAIRDVEVKPIRDHLPDCPESVAEHFDRELAADKSRRAASGRELHERLVELERRLVE